MNLKRKNSVFAILIFCVCFLVFMNLKTEKQIDFSSDIKPILNNKCISCHGGVKKTAGFSLLFREEALANTDEGSPAIVPGKSKLSRLIQRLHESDPQLRMPFEKPALSNEEIKLLTKWIDQGAKWGTHWAYIPPKKAELPIKNKKFEEIDFYSSPIDHFISARLEEKRLSPNPTADQRILARRVSFDLTGLPPEQKLYDSFLENKISYETFVDSLLSSMAYGEKWASWWLDLARYADTKGYEADRGRKIWKYRDWVIQALNEDMPFDEFTIQQLAGDLIENPTEESYVATGFHRNTMNNDEGGTSNEEFRVAAVIDRVNTTFDVWQGTTMSCVQCHSHPYDPIRHKEYFEIMAFFNNTQDHDHTTDEPNYRLYNNFDKPKVEKVLNWIDDFGSHETKLKYQDLLFTFNPKTFTNETTTEIISDAGVLNSNGELYFFDNGRAIIKNINTEDNDQMFAFFSFAQKGVKVKIRNQSKKGEVLAEFSIPIETDWLWNRPNGKNKEGFTVISPFKKVSGNIDLFVEVDGSNVSPESIQKYGDKLVQFHWFGFVPSLPGKKEKGFRNIQNDLVALLNADVETSPIMLENSSQKDTYLFERGNWLTPTEKVYPGTPKSLNKWNEDWEPNRLGLAKWILDEENALTSRTLVNRVWHQIFGTGIVSTVEDMGTQSEPPTHPALLDWMSVNLIESQQWSLKELIKSIVLSSTYKQSSKTTPEKLNIDPNNLFYSRGPKVRLQAEEVRDQALFVAGILSRKMGGVGVMPPQPDGVWQSPYSGEAWIESKGEDRYRRAVYTYLKRTSLYPSFVTFDAGTREFCLINRITTNTPLQALVTLNDPVYLEAAYQLAANYDNIDSKDMAISKMYSKATYRDIDRNTLQILGSLYEDSINRFNDDTGLTEDFLELGKTTVKHAALTIVANAIMNLDEFLNH